MVKPLLPDIGAGNHDASLEQPASWQQAYKGHGVFCLNTNKKKINVPQIHLYYVDQYRKQQCK
jgi:hypothetical protein